MLWGMSMSILFTLKIPSKDQERLIEKYPNEELVFSEGIDESIDQINKAEVVVTFGTDLNEKIIEQAENLKMVAVLSAGIDELPFEALKKKDVIITNVRGIHKIPMAEYAISMLLQVYRDAKQITGDEKKHVWERSKRAWEISGKTMLVAGTGAIGQEVARLAKAFNMHTIGVSRSGRDIKYFDENIQTKDMKSKLPEADFVVSVLPSTKETQNFYTYELFQAMKNTTVFLNMGRGNVVETDTIIKAIQEKEIMHAILDVFEEEPLPVDHPLWEMKNITITPHISGISPHYLDRALVILEENLDVYTKDGSEYVNQVDLSRGY